MDPLISIIVPAYNAEAFLSPCIRSILDQSFQNLELIVVDDGSTDGTADICRRFKETDPRLKYIYKSNGGVIQALKLGVENACGEWIAFCDHDDTLPTDALESLYLWTSPNTDLIAGFSFSGDGNSHTTSIEAWRAKMIASDPILCTRWAKLYRRSIMDGDTAEAPASIKMGEDMVMNIKAAFKTEKDITIVNKKVYNYYRNANSFSVHFKWTASWCASVYTVIHDILLENGKKEEFAASLIHNGLGMMKKLVITGAYPEQRKLRGSALVQMIQADIADSGYAPSRKEKLLLKYPSSLLVRVFLQSSRLLEIAGKVCRNYFGHGTPMD